MCLPAEFKAVLCSVTKNDELCKRKWKIKGMVVTVLNTFAASYLNTQGLNNSCLKSRQR